MSYQCHLQNCIRGDALKFFSQQEHPFLYSGCSGCGVSFKEKLTDSKFDNFKEYPERQHSDYTTALDLMAAATTIAEYERIKKKCGVGYQRANIITGDCSWSNLSMGFSHNFDYALECLKLFSKPLYTTSSRYYMYFHTVILRVAGLVACQKLIQHNNIACTCTYTYMNILPFQLYSFQNWATFIPSWPTALTLCITCFQVSVP